jgi:hypothetical protein
LARSTYKKAQILQAKGEKSQAKNYFEMAYTQRKELKPEDRRSVADVTEADFDNMVIFWSR